MTPPDDPRDDPRDDPKDKMRPAGICSLLQLD